MIRKLRTAYPSRYGTPTITRISTAIFTKTYFAHCTACGFCHDSCCSYGVDVSVDEIARLESYADALRIDLVLRVAATQVRAGIDGRDAHLAHIALLGLAGDL
jgi:hypothetical protein